MPTVLLGRRTSGYRTDLLHQRQHVRNTPVLTDLTSAVEPHDVNELHLHPVRCRRYSHELALVRGHNLHPRHGLVSIRDEVLDLHAHIGKRSQQHPEELQRPLLRGRQTRAALVLNEIICDQLPKTINVSGANPLIRIAHRHRVVHAALPELCLSTPTVTPTRIRCRPIRAAAAVTTTRGRYANGDRTP